MAWIVLNGVGNGNPEYNIESNYIVAYHASVVPVSGKKQKKTLVSLLNGVEIAVIETPAEIKSLIKNW